MKHSALASNQPGADRPDRALLARTLRALEVLSGQGYETARVMRLALEVVNELLTERWISIDCIHDELCLSSLLSSRLGRLRDARRHRPLGGRGADPAFLLLQRAIEDCERLLSGIRLATLPGALSDAAFERDLERLALSVIAAEYLEWARV